MDVSWCPCGRQLQQPDAIYCSQACRQRDSSSAVPVNLHFTRTNRQQQHHNHHHSSAASTSTESLYPAPVSSHPRSSNHRDLDTYSVAERERDYQNGTRPVPTPTNAAWAGSNRDGIMAWANQVPASAQDPRNWSHERTPMVMRPKKGGIESDEMSSAFSGTDNDDLEPSASSSRLNYLPAHKQRRMTVSSAAQYMIPISHPTRPLNALPSMSSATITTAAHPGTMRYAGAQAFSTTSSSSFGPKTPSLSDSLTPLPPKTTSTTTNNNNKSNVHKLMLPTLIAHPQAPLSRPVQVPVSPLRSKLVHPQQPSSIRKKIKQQIHGRANGVVRIQNAMMDEGGHWYMGAGEDEREGEGNEGDVESECECESVEDAPPAPMKASSRIQHRERAAAREKERDRMSPGTVLNNVVRGLKGFGSVKVPVPTTAASYVQVHAYGSQTSGVDIQPIQQQQYRRATVSPQHPIFMARGRKTVKAIA